MIFSVICVRTLRHILRTRKYQRKSIVGVWRFARIAKSLWTECAFYAAEALQKQVAAKFSNLDVNLINGGQPVYYYIISVE